MKKTLLSHLISVITLTFVILLCFSACGSGNSLSGTWKVKEYRINGQTYGRDIDVDVLGENFPKNNDNTITFFSSGYVDIYNWTGSNTRETYEIEDNKILIYNDSGELDDTLIVVNDTIEAYISDHLVMIFEKKGTIPNSV